MASRLGIELSPAACRLVEIEGRLKPGDRGETPRVRSFAVLPPSGPETDAMLASLKGRQAAVVVWGPPSEHRQVVVTSAGYEAMRREAVHALSTLGLKTETALADIAPVPAKEQVKRRPVAVALAAATPMLEAIHPVLAAGISVRTLATPAMALGSMAHLRRALSAPGAVEAYIAVEETASCIALMRDGALAIARELAWGYVQDLGRGDLRSRDDIAARLASELEQYLDAVGAPAAAQVCICGGVPDLRTMAVALTERLDVEVEPLDSMFGIDESRLPDPADDFRDRVAELRIAWAAAADWPPYLNLLRARRRERSRRVLAAVAIAAGVTAGIGGATQIAGTDWWHRASSAAPRTTIGQRRSTPAPAQVPPGRAANRPQPPAQPRTAPRPAPLVARSNVPRAALLARLPRAPEPTLTAALRQPPPAPVASVMPPAAAPPVVRAPQPAAPPLHPSPLPSRPASTTPSPTLTQRTAPPSPTAAQRTTPPAGPARMPSAPAPAQAAATPPVTSLPAPRARTAVPPSRPPQIRNVPQPVPRQARPAPPAPKPVLSFDATLETILYSSDRKLAIIDGRIVGVGDLVRGARILEITPTAVMLRDAQGRLRRLALGASGK